MVVLYFVTAQTNSMPITKIEKADFISLICGDISFCSFLHFHNLSCCCDSDEDVRSNKARHVRVCVAYDVRGSLHLDFFWSCNTSRRDALVAVPYLLHANHILSLCISTRWSMNIWMLRLNLYVNCWQHFFSQSYHTMHYNEILEITFSTHTQPSMHQCMCSQLLFFLIHHRTTYSVLKI